MAIRITKMDLIWSYGAYMLNAGSSLILLPFMLRQLPQRELGLWFTFMSLGALATLLDLGFAPTITRNITYCWGGAKLLKSEGLGDYQDENSPNYQLLNLAMSTSKRIYMVISLLALTILLTVGTFYVASVASGLFAGKIKLAWFLFCAGVFLNIYFDYWSSFLKGVGAIKESQKALAVSQVVKIVVSLVGLFMGYGLLAVSVAYLLSGLAFRQISKYFFLRQENLKEILSEVRSTKDNKRERKEMFSIFWYNAWRIGLVSLGAFSITQVNTMICSAYFGLNMTASYGLTLQLYVALISFANIFFNSYQPVTSEARLRRDEKKLKKVLSVSLTVGWISFLSGWVVIVFFGAEVIQVLGSKTELLTFGAVAYMGLYLFLEFNHSMFASFITTGNSVPFVKAALGSGITVIVMSLILVKFTTIGIWSLLLSQSLVQLIYNNWKWPYVVLQEMKIGIKDIVSTGFTELRKKVIKSIV